ncbi:MAG TPA: hypothetical protein VGK26_03380 [Thermoanaerobaculia bacterium]|jgi:hypothetical protein
MKVGRLLAAALAALVVFFAYGFLINGMLIRDHYQPYSAVYRSADALAGYAPFGLAGTLLAMLSLAMLYAKGYEGGSGAAEGVRFGALIGIFVACTHVVDNYVTLNIGGRLAAELAVAAFFQWIAVGLVVGLVYGRRPRPGSRERAAPSAR